MIKNGLSVTIGIPVYNGERYIRYALDSLLAQTFTDFELIISDNCSIDNTQEICKQYAIRDARIKYIRQAENLGALGNFQFLIDEAVGECFMWAAYDDAWDATWLSVVYKKLKELENFAVFSKLIHIDEFSAPILHPASQNRFDFSGSALVRKITFFLQPEAKGKTNISYSLFRTKDLQGIHLLKYDQDYYMLFDWLNEMQFTAVDEVSFYKRIHAAAEGVRKPKSMTLRILQVLSLKTIFDSFKSATGYLKYSYGYEKLILIFLMPVKVFLEHLFRLQHVLKRLLKF
jgi:glycosyltransferase involved in cell wall biosynthesis